MKRRKIRKTIYWPDRFSLTLQTLQPSHLRRLMTIGHLGYHEVVFRHLRSRHLWYWRRNLNIPRALSSVLLPILRYFLCHLGSITRKMIHRWIFIPVDRHRTLRDSADWTTSLRWRVFFLSTRLFGSCWKMRWENAVNNGAKNSVSSSGWAMTRPMWRRVKSIFLGQLF